VTRLRVAAALLIALFALAAGGAGAGGAKLAVFAAASLAEVLPQIDAAPSYNFAGSNQLALQIRQGAPVDVFASASPDSSQDLFRRGLVEKPRAFASNQLVLAVPRSNPARLRSVFDLARREGLRLVIGTPRLPAGAYARRVLSRLGLSSVLRKVVSEEPDVKSVLGKVVLGEADAGFVYMTDIKPVGDRVSVLRIPAWAQPKVRYEIAAVRSSQQADAARAFVELVVSSPRARRLLSRAGFDPT
jgi:molybdate transport system substrate-binding protein